MTCGSPGRELCRDCATGAAVPGTVGPAGVLAYALAGRHAPEGRTVETFTLVTASALGTLAAGAALGGVLVDRLGPGRTLLATAASAATAATAATAASALALAAVIATRSRTLAGNAQSRRAESAGAENAG